MIDIDKNQKNTLLTYAYAESYFRADQDWIIHELRNFGVVLVANRIFTLTTDSNENKSRLEVSSFEFMEEYPNVKFKIGALITLIKDKLSGLGICLPSCNRTKSNNIR